MNATACFRHVALSIAVFVSTASFAQTNEQMIKGKWRVDKLEIEKNTPDALRAKQEVENTLFDFGNKELVISKRIGAGETVIKKGPYGILGYTLILGKDEGEIITISERQLTVKIRE